MEPILKCIARAYANRYPNLSDICFLFPNKRCGKFFIKYLKENCHYRGKVITKTISEFVKEISGKEEAGRIEQLFTLYDSYLHINRRKLEEGEKLETDFDAFRNWGETIISDFNGVDQYMVNVDEIFKNVKDYRKITTNFLTDAQKEVLKEYFGHEYFGPSDSFWKMFEDESNLSSLKRKFIDLWQILAPLYHEFTDRLSKKGLSTPGRIYRDAAEIVKEKTEASIKYKKVVVFGFNALNEAERTIFRELKKFSGYEGYDDFIDFIWDATGPVLTNTQNSASKFINSNKKYFKTAEWIENAIKESNSDHYPEIKIISSPSNSWQSKIASNIIREKLREDKEFFNEAETVLVLPDESLLINVLYSMPDELEDINLTMGYSFRQTGVAAFMGLIRRLYANMRESKGEKMFFNKDVKLLLSHPYSFILFEDKEIESFIDYINRFHKITLSNEEINKFIKDSDILFNLPDKDGSPESIFMFIGNLFDKIEGKISLQADDISTSGFELSHIQIYRKHIQKLRDSLLCHQVKLTTLGVLYQIDRLVSQEMIGFRGEPLRGFQIMGMLETRGLDFKEVIIMSMNEGLMPKRSKVKSFIPETIRREFGLPPSRYSEEIFAYYFFRLISRAEKVTLIYDGRSGVGMQKGGESRYLLQLRHFVGAEKIMEESWKFNLQPRSSKDASIEKNEYIKLLVNRFKEDGSTSKNLSSSSLNNYRECQVKFFLRNVMDLNPDPEDSDFINAITVGDIVHEIMMELYLEKADQKKFLKNPYIITKEGLKKHLDDKNRVWNLICRKINSYHYKLDSSELNKPLPISAEIVARQIQKQIEEIIKHDMTLTPFKLYGCEISENIKIKIAGGEEVNFRFAIDRLDKINYKGEERLRIVDYKTGQRKRTAKSFEEVLNGDYNSEQIFQLFTYAWLLQQYDIEGKENVITEIYFVPDFIASKPGLPKIGKKLVEDYGDYSEEFSIGIEEMISDIFNSPLFREAPNIERCLKCPFRRVCCK